MAADGLDHWGELQNTFPRSKRAHLHAGAR